MPILVSFHDQIRRTGAQMCVGAAGQVHFFYLPVIILAVSTACEIPSASCRAYF